MITKNTTSSSFPFCSILALIFITLKLLGHITWSWWWVLSPLWIPTVLLATIILGGALLVAIWGK